MIKDWSELILQARSAAKSCEVALLVREYGEAEKYAATLKDAGAQLEEMCKIARRLAALT